MRNLFILIALFLLIINCNNDKTNIDDPPEIVKWVKKTPDDSLCSERGIDAHSGQAIENAILIEWSEVADDDIESYIVYTTDVDTGYGYPINFYQMISLIINDAEHNGFDYNLYADNSYSFFFDIEEENLHKNRYCYFYIMAKDKGGNYSQHSDTIKYNLIEASTALDYNQSEEYFSWSWPNTGASSQIILRIERGPINWVPVYIRRIDGSESQLITDYYNAPKLYKYNLNFNFIQGTTYRFRIDNSFGEEDKGAESQWRQFTIN